MEPRNPVPGTQIPIPRCLCHWARSAAGLEAGGRARLLMMMLMTHYGSICGPNSPGSVLPWIWMGSPIGIDGPYCWAGRHGHYPFRLYNMVQILLSAEWLYLRTLARKKWIDQCVMTDLLLDLSTYLLQI